MARGGIKKVISVILTKNWINFIKPWIRIEKITLDDDALEKSFKKLNLKN